MEISLTDGAFIDPANEQVFLAAFQALAVKLRSTLQTQEKLETTISVTLK
jgi:hypothetical protein